MKREPQQAEQLVHLLGCSEQVKHGALQGIHLFLAALTTAPVGHDVGQNPLYYNLPGLQIWQINWPSHEAHPSEHLRQVNPDW